MFNKFTQKLGFTQNDRDLTSELSDMQERYAALKQSHDIALQMLNKAKGSDNSISEAYERLKKQFNDLSLYLSLKRSGDIDKLRLQQEELSKRKDVLDAREFELNDREKQMEVRSKCIEIYEAGKR